MPADFLDIAYAQQASIARDVASRLMRQEALYWSSQETISATSAQRPLPPSIVKVSLVRDLPVDAGSSESHSARDLRVSPAFYLASFCDTELVVKGSHTDSSH